MIDGKIMKNSKLLPMFKILFNLFYRGKIVMNMFIKIIFIKKYMILLKVHLMMLSEWSRLNSSEVNIKGVFCLLILGL